MRSSATPTTGLIILIGVVVVLSSCAANSVKQRYNRAQNTEKNRYEQALANIDRMTHEKIVDLTQLSVHPTLAVALNTCHQDLSCQKTKYENFMMQLRSRYNEADFVTVLSFCHKKCKTPQQLEYILAMHHNAALKRKQMEAKEAENKRHNDQVNKLSSDFQRDYNAALARDRQTRMAFAAGLASYGQSMQQQQAAYAQPYSNSSGYSQPYQSNPYSIQPFTLPQVSAGPCPYDPRCLNNPYSAGSPYKADGLMNPYSRYGSPYSNKSWTNPYATDAPKLYNSQGNYLGKLSSNPYDPDSTSNPYGRYGSRYSPTSINNPYGAGNPYSPSPIYVVPSP